MKHDSGDCAHERAYFFTLCRLRGESEVRNEKIVPNTAGIVSPLRGIGVKVKRKNHKERQIRFTFYMQSAKVKLFLRSEQGKGPGGFTFLMESGKVKGNKTEAGVSRGLRLFRRL